MSDPYDTIGDFGLTDDQFRAAAVAMGSAVAAWEAIAAALRPALEETIRSVNRWHTEMSRARLLPRQYRNTIMQKKLRGAFR